MGNAARPTTTVEEYLETILNMISEKKTVLAVRLAEKLQVSPPTVTATLQRMLRDGLITVDQHKEISLTKEGLKNAFSIVRRHRLAERLLTDFLKIPWDQAHKEACLLEHGISDKVEQSLYHALGKPSTCPHGNPIPMDDTLAPFKGSPLDTIAVGETLIVERVSEEADQIENLMKYFDQIGIKPDVSIELKEVADYAGTITVLINNKEHTIGSKAAAMIWVKPSTV